MRSAEDAAIAATLSLLLEVSGDPKSGNVDRRHDIEGLRYEDFLASAAAAFPAFLNAANTAKIGDSVLYAVKKSLEWQRAGNVHFGAFLLLVPLVTGWRGESKEEVAEIALKNLKSTGVEDSLKVLEAFRISGARVLETRELSLRSEETARQLLERRMNLYDWMKLAPEENLIARELTEGFRISLEAAEKLKRHDSRGIVVVYHELLAKYPDPLVAAKFGKERSLEVCEIAKKALESGAFEELDERLVREGVNPGTIADITAAAIFLAICDGWRP
ncbi:MAG: triphosphoribosyl-dephospho-CoA synthase [Archaeoglobaceae archaeon]